MLQNLRLHLVGCCNITCTPKTSVNHVWIGLEPNELPFSTGIKLLRNPVQFENEQIVGLDT